MSSEKGKKRLFLCMVGERLFNLFCYSGALSRLRADPLLLLVALWAWRVGDPLVVPVGTDLLVLRRCHPPFLFVALRLSFTLIDLQRDRTSPVQLFELPEVDLVDLHKVHQAHCSWWETALLYPSLHVARLTAQRHLYAQEVRKRERLLVSIRCLMLS